MKIKKILILILAGLAIGLAHAAEEDQVTRKLEEEKDLNIPSLNAACDNGKLSACFGLAGAYKRGKSVQQDIPKTVELLQKACDGAFAIACNNLGVMYAT